MIVEQPEVREECIKGQRNCKETKHPKCDGTHFRDGRRKIDYVLVYEEVSLASSRSSSNSQVHPSPLSPHQERKSELMGSPIHSTSKQNRKTDIRQTFLDKLKLQGLEVEEVWSLQCLYLYDNVTENRECMLIAMYRGNVSYKLIFKWIFEAGTT